MFNPPLRILVVSPQSLQAWIPAISALGSLVLTGALVYLYFRQTRIQDRQADLQAAQQTLLESQAKPIVEAGPVDVEGDTVYVTLSNVGGGVATDLRCVTEIEFPERNGLDPVETSVPLEKHIKRDAGDSSDGFTMVRGTNSLKPYTEDVPFVGTPTVGVETDGDRTEYEFLEGVRYLVDHGITNLRCTISLEYTDSFGTSEREVLLIGGGVLDSGTVLSEVVDPV